MSIKYFLFLTSLFLSFSFSHVFAQTSPTPTPSYTEENAIIQTQDSLNLDARWTLPQGTPRAVVLLLPGSGNVNFDGDVSSPFVGSGHRGQPARLSAQLAQALAQAGYASLRYTKRGYTTDPAQAVNQPINLLAQDARDAFQSLVARFPSLRRGIIGFSEGALLAVRIASRHEEHPGFISREIPAVSADALFLLGLPSRPIDDMLAYQFLEWPSRLLQTRLDRDHNGTLDATELAALTATDRIPLLGATLSGVTAQDLDANHDNALSFTQEIIPAYQTMHGVLMQITQTPAFAPWYRSLQTMERFSSMAAQIHNPVYLYHALDDAQVSWSWVATDQRYFAGTHSLRLYPGLGHCFAPMEGSFGQVKTSGPFDAALVSDLVTDLGTAFPVQAVPVVATPTP